MLKLSTKIIVMCSLAFVLFTVPAPKAKAFEPITIAMLAAPIVIPIVKAMLPYIIKGGENFFGAMIDVFVDMAGIFLLPIGMMESTVGAPFGLFDMGLGHMGDGALAPFKMMWSMMKTPVRVFTG